MVPSSPSIMMSWPASTSREVAFSAKALRNLSKSGAEVDQVASRNLSEQPLYSGTLAIASLVASWSKASAFQLSKSYFQDAKLPRALMEGRRGRDSVSTFDLRSVLLSSRFVVSQGTTCSSFSLESSFFHFSLALNAILTPR